MIYKVKIKDTDIIKTVKASNELEARVKYCKEQGFDYRVFACKLEVITNKKGRTK